MNPIYGTIHSCNIIPRQERAWDKEEVTASAPTPPSDQFDAWMSIRVHLPYGTEIPIGGGVFVKSAQPEVLSPRVVADFLRYENITAETIQQSLNELALVKATFNGDDPQADAISRAEAFLCRLRSRVYGGGLNQVSAGVQGKLAGYRELAGKMRDLQGPTPDLNAGQPYSGGQEVRQETR